MLPCFLQIPAPGRGIATLGEWFTAGGPLMWPILAGSVLTIGLACERYLRLQQRRLLPQVVRDAVEQIQQGHQQVIAAGMLEAQAPAARVLAAGLRRAGHALADVEKAMEDQLAREAGRLRANIRGITLVAALAPMLGLLGTVLGIADAFAAVERTGLGKADSSEALAAGIKVALHTTILGLVVAIPATVLAALLQGRARRLVAQIGEAVAPAIEALAARPAATAAARQQTEADAAFVR